MGTRGAQSFCDDRIGFRLRHGHSFGVDPGEVSVKAGNDLLTLCVEERWGSKARTLTVSRGGDRRPSRLSSAIFCSDDKSLALWCIGFPKIRPTTLLRHRSLHFPQLEKQSVQLLNHMPLPQSKRPDQTHDIA